MRYTPINMELGNVKQDVPRESSPKAAGCSISLWKFGRPRRYDSYSEFGAHCKYLSYNVGIARKYRNLNSIALAQFPNRTMQECTVNSTSDFTL
jgi:hypothetical protein